MAMDEKHDRDAHGPPREIWVSVVIIARVAFMLLVFISLFLAIFLGYFTYPILLIALITVIYMLMDVGLYITLFRKRQSRQERDEFLRSYTEKLDHKD